MVPRGSTLQSRLFFSAEGIVCLIYYNIRGSSITGTFVLTTPISPTMIRDHAIEFDHQGSVL